MNWEVEFTDQARRDLRDILDYISYELQEPQVAVKLVRQITNFGADAHAVSAL